MQSKIDDISKIIKEQIRNYESKTRQDEIGYVISVGDGISKVHGLEKCKANELLEFSNGSYGMALNLEETFVSCVLLGNDVGIKEGSIVKRTGRVVSVPTGEGLIGRVVDALGNPLDGKGPIGITEYSPIERRAYGIIERKSVSVPLQTGIKAIDNIVADSIERTFGHRAVVSNAPFGFLQRLDIYSIKNKVVVGLADLVTEFVKFVQENKNVNATLVTGTYKILDNIFFVIQRFVKNAFHI